MQKILRKFKNYLKKQVLRLTIKDMSQHELNSDICQFLLNALLNVEEFKDYQPAIGSVTVLVNRTNSLTDLITKVNEANHFVRDKEFVPANWVVSYEKLSQTVKSVDTFISIDNGYYVDPYKSLLKYKEALNELCQLMEPASQISYGAPEHNKRMLTKFFNENISVLVKLIEVTLK